MPQTYLTALEMRVISRRSKKREGINPKYMLSIRKEAEQGYTEAFLDVSDLESEDLTKLQRSFFSLGYEVKYFTTPNAKKLKVSW